MKGISKEVISVFDELCKKNKKHCALCDRKLGKPTKEDLARSTGRFWCSLVSFRHPKYKTKNYRLCGDCYGGILRHEDKEECLK